MCYVGGFEIKYVELEISNMILKLGPVIAKSVPSHVITKSVDVIAVRLRFHHFME